MFAKLLPSSCSRLNVFLSYATEQRGLGAEIAQALKNAGHQVFFDIESIPASGDYIERIRSAIEDADRFVFLASKDSLTPGKFALTELEFAKERWPSPQGKVIPVLIDKRVPLTELPVYLRSINVLTVQGNAVAEVVSAVQKTRQIGTFCKAVSFGGATAAVLAAGFVGSGIGMMGRPTDIVLMAPHSIHFRPVVDAPLRAADSTAAPNWAASPLTVTLMPVAYTHRTEPGRRARILGETLDLSIGGAVQSYRAIYIVEITDAPCGERWYCIKGNAGIETLEPGASINRETLFVPVREDAPTWRQFVDDLLSKPGVPISVAFRSTVEVSEDTGIKRLELKSSCSIDADLVRKQVSEAGFAAGGAVKPVHIETDCLQPPVPVSAPSSASASTASPTNGSKP